MQFTATSLPLKKGEHGEQDGGQSEKSSFMSPWIEPRALESGTRTRGWDGSRPLIAMEMKDFLKEKPELRKEYKKLYKEEKRPEDASSAAHPLTGLPPTWQAIYSTVPHLDPRPAYKHWRKEHSKKQVEAEAEAAGKAPKKRGPEEQQQLEEGVRELEQQVRSKKALLAEKEKICVEWERKLNKVRKVERDDEVRSKAIIRRLEKASYAHGVLQGQMKSSDAYFTFIEIDTKTDHTKKMQTLSRSVALLGTQIDSLKTEVRVLLRADAEAQKQPKLSDDAGPPGDGADDLGMPGDGPAGADGSGAKPPADGDGTGAPPDTAAPAATDASD